MFIVTTGGEEFNPAGIGELYAPRWFPVQSFRFRSGAASHVVCRGEHAYGYDEARQHYVWQRCCSGRTGSGATLFDLYETLISAIDGAIERQGIHTGAIRYRGVPPNSRFRGNHERCNGTRIIRGKNDGRSYAGDT